MANYKVLLTDYAWPDLDIEREILTSYDAELIVAPDHQLAKLIDPLNRQLDFKMTFCNLARSARKLTDGASQSPNERKPANDGNHRHGKHDQ